MTDPALVGLGGVLVGTASTLLATSLTLKSNEREAERAREASRADRARELLADGYVQGVDALEWLSSMHVEDSVDPQFADEYVPKTEAAVPKLRNARELILKVAALSTNQKLAGLAYEVAVQMGVLDHAWHECQQARRRILAGGTSTNLNDFYKKQFDKNWDRLMAARTSLIGFTGSDLPDKEIAAGTVLPDSLLYRLRELPT